MPVGRGQRPRLQIRRRADQDFPKDRLGKLPLLRFQRALRPHFPQTVVAVFIQMIKLPSPHCRLHPQHSDQVTQFIVNIARKHYGMGDFVA